MRTEPHPVVIIGAGPTGMALAIDLALRNTPSVLVERYANPQRIPKGQNLTQRTGEHFKFWGVTDEIKKATLIPPEYGNEGLVAYGSLLSGYHYDWFKRGAVREFYAADNERLPQYETEKILRRRVEQFDCITALYGWSFTDCQQTDDHVSVKLVQTDGDKKQEIGASYLVGCDGARSLVRKAASINQTSDGSQRRMALLVFHSPELHNILDSRFPGKTIFNALDPEYEGYWKFFGRIDLDANWFFHAPVPIDANLENVELVQLLHSAVGAKFKFNLNYSGYWDLRFTQATNYRSGRLLVAGDAAHSHPPYGGYGVNIGFEDARNLAWKLAAIHHNWGTDRLIDSYSAERHPVFASTRDEFILRMIKSDAAFISEFSPAKDQQAFELAWHKRAGQGQREVIGYVPHYLGSPVVCRTGSQITDVDSADDQVTSKQSILSNSNKTEIPMQSGAKGIHTHEPTAGMHLSPGFFNDATNLFDQLSKDFTLLVPPGGESVARKFERSAKALGIPLLCLGVTINPRHKNSELASSSTQSNVKQDDSQRYQCQCDACVLVRPDHFVAWVEQPNLRLELLESDYASHVLAHCTANLH